MPTGPEHYRAAEHLTRILDDNSAAEDALVLAMLAQAHATLALAAATSSQGRDTKSTTNLTARPVPATTWTSPDGTLYDLTHGLRDEEGDVWKCVGWYHPQDGDPVPVMWTFGNKYLLTDVIERFGPLTDDTDGPTEAPVVCGHPTPDLVVGLGPGGIVTTCGVCGAANPLADDDLSTEAAIDA